MSSIGPSPHDFMGYRGIPESKIPNIDLYMDQILTFFDDSFGFFRREPEESILTKAMVNNYVKADVMEKPSKKKYNKSQVMKLIMIYQLKQVLAINDILVLFNEAGKMGLKADRLYERFLGAENSSYAQLADDYDRLLKEETSRETVIDAILRLTTESCAKKRLAEKLLDRLKRIP
jgi:hypothetical protein